MATTNNGNTTQQGGGMTETLDTHIMSDGTVMAGAYHNAPSPSLNTTPPNRITPNRVAPNTSVPNTSATYKIYGTNELYSGRTVEVGGQLYTTVGGAREGNSYQLIANTPTINTPAGQSRFSGNAEIGGGTGNTTPVGSSNNNNQMSQGVATGGSSY
mgnify:CR=1 FL=1